jgi:hypothetical protein
MEYYIRYRLLLLSIVVTLITQCNKDNHKDKDKVFLFLFSKDYIYFLAELPLFGGL